MDIKLPTALTIQYASGARNNMLPSGVHLPTLDVQPVKETVILRATVAARHGREDWRKHGIVNSH